MKSMVPNTLLFLFGLFLASVNASAVLAQDTAPQAPAAESTAPAKAKPDKQPVEIRIGYLRSYAPQLALSALDC